DAVSWLRVLTLVKGIGHRTAERAIDALIAAADPGAEIAKLADKARGTADGGLKRLGALLAELHSGEKRPPEQIAITLEYYLPVMREAYADDYPKRARDLEHFQN